MAAQTIDRGTPKSRRLSANKVINAADKADESMKNCGAGKGYLW
jgi:hypothetical protein